MFSKNNDVEGGITGEDRREWWKLCILAFCISVNSSKSPMREETQLEEVEFQRGRHKDSKDVTYYLNPAYPWTIK